MGFGKPGLMGSMRQLGGSVLSIFSTRLALLVNELQEEKLRLTQMLFFALFALVCFSFGLLLLTVFVVVLFWDSQRLLVLGLAGTFFFVLAGVMTWLLLAKVRQGSNLFAASLAELEKDRQWLRGAQE
jgi:uncharacterized membrane protein YqjE